jgi:putative transposase
MVEVDKEFQVTEATWYRWLNQYGSDKNAEASKRTKEWRRRTPGSSGCLRRRNWPSTIFNEVSRGKL